MASSQKPGKRPVIDLPYTQVEVFIEIIAAIGIVLMFAMLVVWWGKVPTLIPTHFGANGTPDDWGGKGSLVIFPVVGLALYIMVTIATRFPHVLNYMWKITEENASKQYHIIRIMMNCTKILLTWSFAYINWQTIQVAMDKATGLGSGFLIGTMVALVLTFSVGLYYGYKAK